MHAPRFAATAIATLALGVGVNAGVFSAVRVVLLDSLPYREPDRIVEMWQVVQRAMPHQFSVADVEALRRETNAFELVASATTQSFTVRGEGDAEVVDVVSISNRFFDVFGVPAAIGRTIAAADGAAIAVISDRIWSSQFARRPDVVGRALRIDGVAWTVGGVMPSGFTATGRAGGEPGVWIPRPAGSPQPASVFARLAPGVPLETARAHADAIIRPRQPPALELAGGRSLAFDGVGMERVGEGESRAAAPALLLLQGVAGLLLLLASANLGTLLLAEMSSRAREFGVRAALGADRARLAGLVVVEAGVIATLGGAAGIGVAAAVIGMLASADASVLPQGTLLSLGGVEIAVALCLSWVAILTGALPAMLALGSDPMSSMRDTTQVTTGRGARRLRSILVSLQVVVAVVVLTGAGLLINSFLRVVSEPLGFDPRRVVTAELTAPPAASSSREALRSFTWRLQDALTAELGTVPRALGDNLPFGPTSSRHWNLGSASYDFSTGFMAEVAAVTPGFFELLRIPLERGRLFAAGDNASSAPVAVVNRAFVERFGRAGDVLGAEVLTARLRFRIVGVVGDVRSHGLARPPEPMVYTVIEQDPRSHLGIAVRTADSARTTAAVRTAVRAVDPDVPLRVGSFDARIARREARRRFLVSIASLFAILGASLATVGIYGVTAHVAAQRTRELAIRIALGAEPVRLRVRTVAQGLVPVAAGLAVGAIAAWWIGRGLGANSAFRSQLYEITPHDPLTFVVAGGALLCLAAWACWLPTRRIAVLDPVRVLKVE